MCEGARFRYDHRRFGLFPGHAGRRECGRSGPANHRRRCAGDFPGDRARLLFRRFLHLDRLGMTEEEQVAVDEERIAQAMQDNDVAICVRGLRNSFGEQVVHEHLDLDVRRGEILGVVGGSGTGKSVLMRSIIGLQVPDEGEVEVFGQPMIGRADEEALAIRKRWGVLFQGGALFSTLTVAENIEVPLREYYPKLDPQLRDEIASYKRSEEHTSEFQSLMRISYAVFCLKKKKSKLNKTYRQASF